MLCNRVRIEVGRVLSEMICFLLNIDFFSYYSNKAVNYVKILIINKHNRIDNVERL